MAKKNFSLTRFTNPSGQVIWRVSGTLNGMRIRKNFQTRQDAVAERDELRIKLLNGESEGQTVWTTLTHDQNRDAIAAVNRLKHAKSTKTLSFAVDYFLRHYQEGAETIPTRKATEEYCTTKFEEQQLGIISSRQERAIGIEMKKLADFYQDRPVDEITAEELSKYLKTPIGRSKAAQSLKTWNNRRGYLSTFFKFCHSRKYIVQNPITHVQQFKVKKARGTADTLSAKDAKELMHWLETYRGCRNKDGSYWGQPGCMVPYFALTLFAGIRPDWKDGEICKMDDSAIRFHTNVILIEPSVSKVNEKRTIKMQPNLKAWLEKYPLSEFPIIPPRIRDHLVEIRKKWTLPHDVMRHTFISMTVGAFRSVGDASLQAGNSEAIIRKHYLDLKSVEEADAFWGIVPNGVTLPPMEKKDGRYVPVAQ